MAWLHTWSGLWAGWVLFVIFLTGTLGVFDEAITRWMKPEKPLAVELSTTPAQRAQAVRHAQAHVEKVAPKGHFWSIGLPNKDEPGIRVFWEDAQEKFQSAKLDAATGAVIPKTVDRETEGGHHFVHMHYEFQAGMAGVWLVGFFTMAMLVALVSGIVIHKRIFKDFFTFRPRKGQRSWLDAHNAVAVLTLPFQLMIAYTGLVVFYATYMPAGIQGHYRQNSAPQEAYFADLLATPKHRDETHISAPVVALDKLLARAETQLGRQASFVVVEHPGDTSASVRVFGPFDEGDGEKNLLTPSGGRMDFDGVTGETLDVQMPRTTRGGDAQMVQRTMRTLHEATFGGYAVKWLYFLCGLAGTAMMATGSILFMVKRRQKSLHEFGAQTPRVYRLIDVLNVAVIAGLSVACIAFLWGNRLIPVGIDKRPQWEMAAFFGVWSLMLVHAALRPLKKAWVEQLALGAALCLALPLVNALTTGRQFVHYAAQGDWLRASVEWTAMALGGLLAYAAWRARNKARQKNQVNTPKTAPVRKAESNEEKKAKAHVPSAQTAMKSGVL